MYAKITKPLYALLIVFEWVEDYKNAYKKLKKDLVNTLGKIWTQFWAL